MNAKRHAPSWVILAVGLMVIALLALLMLSAIDLATGFGTARTVRAEVQALTNGQVAAIQGGQMLLADPVDELKVFLPILIN